MKKSHPAMARKIAEAIGAFELRTGCHLSAALGTSNAMNADRNPPTPAKGNDTAKPASNGDGETPKEADGNEPWEKSELDALKRLFQQFHELQEYLSYYVSAKTDGVKHSLPPPRRMLDTSASDFAVDFGKQIWSWVCGPPKAA